ncbi:hypothetical protein PACTADRAFT_33229 [Pachysolen tannophilus NRRL Y-2460]|uniref:Uncharacterized protein n=1 Tax=Pachysolen tannophilus NRRL Y-2460 TaxID=669874 RepID=A0A1E4TWC5_PACTA|nr:hypothetical protein PACTADRAFT_33229 [Pachysolen tannophilus NRRL Y-2460]
MIGNQIKPRKFFLEKNHSSGAFQVEDNQRWSDQETITSDNSDAHNPNARPYPNSAILKNLSHGNGNELCDNISATVQVTSRTKPSVSRTANKGQGISLNSTPTTPNFVASFDFLETIFISIDFFKNCLKCLSDIFKTSNVFDNSNGIHLNSFLIGLFCGIFVMLLQPLFKIFLSYASTIIRNFLVCMFVVSFLSFIVNHHHKNEHAAKITNISQNKREITENEEKSEHKKKNNYGKIFSSNLDSEPQSGTKSSFVQKWFEPISFSSRDHHGHKNLEVDDLLTDMISQDDSRYTYDDNISGDDASIAPTLLNRKQNYKSFMENAKLAESQRR